MAGTSDGFELFRSALGQLLEQTIDVRNGHVMVNDENIAPGLPAVEQTDLTTFVTAAMDRRGTEVLPCTFASLTHSLRAATNANAFRKLDCAVQLLATHFWETDERLYEESLEESLIQWARKTTGMQGKPTLSDAFGIWVTCEFAPKTSA